MPSTSSSWRTTFHLIWYRHTQHRHSERELFIVNLLVRIHLIIEMISSDRPCAMGV